MGQDDRAFGFLTALDAPSFRNLFLPEKYLLRSLIYNRRCHFLSSKRSARQFQRRFRGALQIIKDRGELTSDPRIVEASLEDRSLAEASKYLTTVEDEKSLIDCYASLFATPGLTARLREIYRLSEDEALRRKALAQEKALVKASDAILRADEDLRLQDYEVASTCTVAPRRARWADGGGGGEAPVKGDVVFPFRTSSGTTSCATTACSSRTAVRKWRVTSEPPSQLARRGTGSRRALGGPRHRRTSPAPRCSARFTPRRRRSSGCSRSSSATSSRSTGPSRSPGLIVQSKAAPYLPDLDFRLAELYVEKSRYIFVLQAEESSTSEAAR